MSPFNALKHLVYFEALAETEEDSQEWRTTTAGLVVLRLLDSWYDYGPASVRENGRGIRNIRSAISEIDEGNPIRNILADMVSGIERAKERDVSAILPRLMAYGRALHFEAEWALSADVYHTILSYASTTGEPDIVIDARMRLGYCYRMMGMWDDAALTYAEAGQLASAQGDIDRVLRASIADAKLAIDRGNLPHAEALLEDTIARAAGNEELVEVRCVALHDRAAVAHLRGEFEKAVQLGYDALKGTRSPSERDRVLADIAASFSELGVLSAARDALVVLAATAQEQYLRWLAVINLLEIAAKERKEPAFEMYRRELADADLPATLEANYHLHVGRGYQMFGRLDQAREAVQMASAIATEHNINQITFEAERILQELDKQEATVWVDEVEPSAEIVHVARAMTELREAAGLAG